MKTKLLLSLVAGPSVSGTSTSKLYASLFALCLLLTSLTGFAQVKIGTNPTTIEPASNLEVEASTGGRKIKVNKTTGQLTIADGTQGAGEILTSDANGGASWETAGTLKIDRTIFVGVQSAQQYLITTQTSPTSFDELKDRIPLVVQPGSLPGYNVSTKQYTIQESGRYRVYGGGQLGGTLPSPGTSGILYLAPYAALHKFDDINNNSFPFLTTFWEGYLPAGQIVDLYVVSQGANQNINVRFGFLTIVKLGFQ